MKHLAVVLAVSSLFVPHLNLTVDMSTSTIVVPNGFAWVAASLLSTTALLVWQSQMVARWRAIAEIKFLQSVYTESRERELGR